MQKLKYVLFMIIVSVLTAFTAFAANSEYAVKIIIDGSELVTDKAPVICNSRTLAPVRPVAEACGADVGWDAATSQVVLTKEHMTVTLTIGSCEMKVYNSLIDKVSTVELETAPVIMDSSTFIVLRPALEALGASVDWDAEKRTISVVTGKKSGNSESTQTVVTAPVTTGNTVDGIEYSGFREMKNHIITEGAPHGLYGRIKTSTPITLVRCRIVGTSMDYTLFFNANDNILSYNIFTYFDKLICFSDAGLGKQTFEIYSAVSGGSSKLVFSYEYTVRAQGAADNVPLPEEVPAGAFGPSDGDTYTDADTVPEAPAADTQAVIGYYGFRKMTGDKIVRGAPHGLYGNVVSESPITLVRCRIVGTDMDYRIQIPIDDDVHEYNVFGYFDQLIRFSDAGLGAQTFEIYAAVSNSAERLLFSYTYTVSEKNEPVSGTASDISYKGEIPDGSDVCLPLEGTVKVTSPYGFRAYNRWEFHKGVDIISSSLAIIAVADGTVVDCATGKNSGVGNYVAIQHEGGWVSLYYHLDSYDVEIGDSVRKGQRFATMGNTGGNYGVHLHFMTCDNWYGNIWSTQNSHHLPPHTYLPQLLSDVVFYNPCFEKVNTDKMILCTFRFPSVLEQGSAFSISSSNPFVASENPLKRLTLTITDENGNVLLSEKMENPEYTVSGLYTYTNITAAFDMMCEFDKLPTGKMKVTVTTVSSLGRERLVYEKDFRVVSAGQSTAEEKAEAQAGLTPEEASKTDAFEGNTEENPVGTEGTDSGATDDIPVISM